MRVCDRHPDRKVQETYLIRSTDTQVDLCESCVAKFNKFLGRPQMDEVEPKSRIFGLFSKESA